MASRRWSSTCPTRPSRIDEQLYRRLGRRFEPELALWGASDDIHMVMIATFGVGRAGVPAIQELCLMPVTRQWLPVADGFEKQLSIGSSARTVPFVKGLHYNLGRDDRVASAVLTDCEGSAPMLFIGPADADESSPGTETCAAGDAPAWTWRRSGEPMPPLPLPRTHSPRTAPTQAERASRTALAG
jgi:hypothetical protein